MIRYAFLSYQTADKLVAAKVKTVLSAIDINCFLAHEDIEVSEEWRIRILEELQRMDLFICILSKNYLQSSYCLQESGIAACRREIGIIPLSIDGTISPGLISHIQSVRILPDNIELEEVFPPIIKHDFEKGIEILLVQLENSGSFREAERRMERILPYDDRLNDAQRLRILEASYKNNQINNAVKCAHDYLPNYIEKYGKLMAKEKLEFLLLTIKQYE